MNGFTVGDAVESQKDIRRVLEGIRKFGEEFQVKEVSGGSRSVQGVVQRVFSSVSGS